MPELDDAFNFVNDFFNESSGLRSDLLSRLQQDISGIGSPVTLGDVSNSPLFPLLKSSAAGQFRQSRDDILSTLPQGGAVNDALQANILNRARTLTEGQAAIGENILNQRLNSLNVGADVATAPLQLAGVQGMLAATQAQLDAEKDIATGEGIGGLLQTVIESQDKP